MEGGMKSIAHLDVPKSEKVVGPLLGQEPIP